MGITRYVGDDLRITKYDSINEFVQEQRDIEMAAAKAKNLPWGKDRENDIDRLAETLKHLQGLCWKSTKGYPQQFGKSKMYANPPGQREHFWKQSIWVYRDGKVQFVDKKVAGGRMVKAPKGFEQFEGFE